MRIHGIAKLSRAEVEKELAAGGRFVVFEYCVSCLIATARRPTEIYFLHAGELGLLRGLPFSLVSLLLGWWGIPWGIIYTPLTLITNLSGGCDVTEQVSNYLNELSSAG